MSYQIKREWEPGRNAWKFYTEGLEFSVVCWDKSIRRGRERVIFMVQAGRDLSKTFGLNNEPHRVTD